ncbi:sortase [Bifidobacterium animalis subsp. animalis]|uniref:Sortase n=1 Tax=Bifidobacterium animalis subsp. lactis TaxID=302911 RepID=A0A8B3RJA4_BIFAN|nr:class C sortase [Bifidobacterium animalis]RYM96722.1 sortase [Bifidobacterium animalis subsp. lactis]RYN15138.1 sortase [Bifidobacterium animalis subsp. animalis]
MGKRTAAKKKSNLVSNLFITLFTLILLVGIGVLSYPSVADWWNRMHASRAVAGYVEQVKSMEPERRAAMLAEADKYNAELPGVADRWHLADNAEQLKRYNETLDITGTGIMGYLSIPKINVQLPIYHGTDEAVLQIALGHLTGSSLPVGGESSHSVVSGHTGLPSAKLITDLDQLKKGDLFQYTVLDRTLTYEVDEINVVLPGEMDKLAIEPGADYSTLITCTPYGVNSHRLLVRGHRVPNPPAEKVGAHYDEPESMLWTAIAIGAGVLLVLLLLAIWLVRRRGKKRKAAQTLESASDNHGTEQRADSGTETTEHGNRT